MCKYDYTSWTAGSAKIILFLNMLKLSKNISFKEKKNRKENEASFEIFKNILFISMESSKLNNYSAWL